MSELSAFELREEVKRITEELKFNNSRLLQLEPLNEAMFGVLSKGNKIENLDAVVEKFISNVNKLNSVLNKPNGPEDPQSSCEGKNLSDYIR